MQLPFLRRTVLSLALCAGSVMANPVEQALTENTAHSQAAQRSQQQVEQLDDATQKMLQDYRTALLKTKTLTGYNQQMRELVAAQQTELTGYQQQLIDLQDTEAAVTPQMQRMLDVLEQFIAADLPFLPYERTERLETLQDLLPRADVSIAEKYRRILEAYQIESDYGRTLEVWRDSLRRDGSELNVDFLRLGRLMLYYQTPDGHETGWWNSQAKEWQVLNGNARRPVAQAIAIARQQKSPDWLALPMKTLALEAQQ